MGDGDIIETVETSSGHFAPRPTAREVFATSAPKEQTPPLTAYRSLGAEFSSLVNTPEGLSKIAEIRAKVEKACRAAYPQPTSENLPRIPLGLGDADDNRRGRLLEKLRGENKQAITARTEAILRGASITNIEEETYFDFGSKVREQERKRIKGEDRGVRNKIGAALSYLGIPDQDQAPDVPGTFKPSAGRLKFEMVTIDQANQAFREGWKSIIPEATD